MGRELGRVRVFVADDHPLYREGVTRAIKERPDLELIGWADDGRDALDEIRELEPDIALLDMKLPSLTGAQIVTALKDEHHPTRALILSAFDDGATVYDVIAAGARGYATKDEDRQTICDAIVAVARGGSYFSHNVQGGLADQMRVRRDDERPLLTKREREVLLLAAEGRSGPEIARKLFLSPHTVKTHLQHIYEKFEVDNRAAAVAKALRVGVLQ